jgi:hypothetical protein
MLCFLGGKAQIGCIFSQPFNYIENGLLAGYEWSCSDRTSRTVCVRLERARQVGLIWRRSSENLFRLSITLCHTNRDLCAHTFLQGELLWHQTESLRIPSGCRALPLNYLTLRKTIDQHLSILAK